MTRIPPARLVLAVAKSAAWGAITLVDPNRLTGWRKHAYWLTMAGGTAAEIAAPTAADDGIYRPVGLTTGVALATAGLTYGAQDLLAKGDAWSIGVLRRAGLKRPRVWAAAAVFGSMLASSLAEAKLASQATAEDDGYDDLGRPLPETLTPLPQDVRRTIELLLDSVDGYGSDELRAQLDDVVCRDETGHFALVADAAAPRTLLDSYTFPATALFTRDGINHVLMLDIEEGRMSYLSHLIEPFQEDESNVDWSIPDAEELQVVVGFEEDDALA